MSCCELALGEQCSRVVRELGEAQGIGYVAPTSTDNARNVPMGVTVCLDQLSIPSGFFQRIEVSPLHIFNNGDFDRFTIIGFDCEHGDHMELRTLSRTPSPLPGDYFIRLSCVGNRPDKNWLKNAVLAYRSRKFFKFVFVKRLPRIAGIGTQELDRYPDDAFL